MQKYISYQKQNNSKEKWMLLAAISVALSLLIASSIWAYSVKQEKLKRKEQETVVKEQSEKKVATVTLYAPIRTIKAGSPLTEADFRDQIVAKNAVPRGAIMNLKEVQGMYAKRDIDVDNILLRGDLSAERASITLPITPGMRAVTIAADAESSIEGWVLPGSKVDVTLTYRQDGKLTTKIIVQNAKVLSYAGSAAMPDDLGGKMRGARGPAGGTVTLEVKPADALTISTSKKLGSLGLLMRAAEDDKATEINSVDQNSVAGTVSNRNPKKCSRGIARMGGKEYSIDCDGRMTLMDAEEEP